MAQPERFEILILDSGKGGKLLAWDMAGSGRRTAVVERRHIGTLSEAARRHSRTSDDGGGDSMHCSPPSQLRSAEAAGANRTEGGNAIR